MYFEMFAFTVVTANQQMRSTTNLLIINLAFADILFVIFCVPFTATDYILPAWPFGDVWCKCVSFYLKRKIVFSCRADSKHYYLYRLIGPNGEHGQWLKCDL